MFGRRDRLEVLRIIPLEAADKRHAHSAGEERALTVGFMAASPARIAENVHVGGVEGQAFVDGAVAAAFGQFMIARPGLIADRPGDLLQQLRMPRRGHADALRKDRRDPGPSHAVQAFAPPVVLRDAQPLDRRREVAQLAELFVESHAREQVFHAALDRFVLIPIRCVRSVIHSGRHAIAAAAQGASVLRIGSVVQRWRGVVAFGFRLQSDRYGNARMIHDVFLFIAVGFAAILVQSFVGFGSAWWRRRSC